MADLHVSALFPDATQLITIPLNKTFCKEQSWRTIKNSKRAQSSCIRTNEKRPLKTPKSLFSAEDKNARQREKLVLFKYGHICKKMWIFVSFFAAKILLQRQPVEMVVGVDVLAVRPVRHHHAQRALEHECLNSFCLELIKKIWTCCWYHCSVGDSLRS